MAIELVLW